MIELATIITGIYFATGGLLLCIIVRRHRDPVKTRAALLKYLVYLLVVGGMIALIHYRLLRYAGAAIAILSLYEVFQVAGAQRRLGHPRFLMVFPLVLLMVYCLLWYCDRMDPRLQLFTYCLVFTFDGFSQLIGQLAGKHLLAPHISPAKTWEGFAGGMLASGLTAFLLGRYMPLHLVLLFWAGTVLFAFYGDLLASHCKRVLGVKDFSNLVPGHGGVLDRFDSLCGAAVFLYFCSYFLPLSH